MEKQKIKLPCLCTAIEQTGAASVLVTKGNSSKPLKGICQSSAASTET
jgi:hypothetical protein